MTQSPNPPITQSPILEYQPTYFSQGRMDFAWEELSEVERTQLYADWEAGKGLIGGHPRLRPGGDRLSVWGLNRPFFRAFALDDPRCDNGLQLRAAIASARPLEVEVGYGRGDFLLDRAARHPERLFIGYEVKTKATRLALGRVEQLGLKNVWFSDDDARVSLPEVVADGRLDAVHVLFPDPWWKDQHKIRRLFAPPFVDLLAAKIRPGGFLHFKSDVEGYGQLVRYLVEQHPAFGLHDPALSECITPHVPTHREYWCQTNNKPVWAFFFERQAQV